MTNQEFINELTKPCYQPALSFIEHDERMRALSKELQFKEWIERITEDGSSCTDEYYSYQAEGIDEALGSRISWLAGLSNVRPIDITRTYDTFCCIAQEFDYEDKKYWVVTMAGQGAVSWLMTDDAFKEEYGNVA